MTKTAFITGATSGIGLACAELFASANYRLIICGRREERLLQFKEKYSAASIHHLVFDVRNYDQVNREISGLPAEFRQIDILINNAGNAHGLDPIYSGNTEDWDAMIDINVKGLLYVSKVIIPWMIERKAGHIINIGSIAGKEVYPNGNVYCASKFAVDALSRGMRIDLNQYGIKVSEVNPGAVNTEFSTVRFKGDTDKANKVYDGFEPLVALDIAEVILFICTRPTHVNIAEVLVLPTAQASPTIVNKQKP
jgi:NADP-dependent 3-hydroxy acid dehydrogenase YdfG